jgi:hypothetical protein
MVASWRFLAAGHPQYHFTIIQMTSAMMKVGVAQDTLAFLIISIDRHRPFVFHHLLPLN